MVRHDEKIAVDDRKHDEHVQPILLDEPPSIWRRLQSGPDERLSIRDIAMTMAAVIVVSFGLTALLPSILTRDVVETATAAVAPPAAQPPETKLTGAVQPVLDAVPAPLPAAAPPAPVLSAAASNASAPAAKTTPALRASNAPSDKQAGGRVAATAPTDLKVAEKTAAVAAPRRPAPTRPALTDEEKAAIERGLRELEKEAGQAKP